MKCAELVVVYQTNLLHCVDCYTEQMLRGGEVEMRSRDEELRFMNMQKAEEERSLSLMKRALPSKKALEQDIVRLQIEASRHRVYVCLSQCVCVCVCLCVLTVLTHCPI